MSMVEYELFDNKILADITLKYLGSDRNTYCICSRTRVKFNNKPERAYPVRENSEDTENLRINIDESCCMNKHIYFDEEGNVISETCDVAPIFEGILLPDTRELVDLHEDSDAAVKYATICTNECTCSSESISLKKKGDAEADEDYTVAELSPNINKEEEKGWCNSEDPTMVYKNGLLEEKPMDLADSAPHECDSFDHRVEVTSATTNTKNVSSNDLQKIRLFDEMDYMPDYFSFLGLDTTEPSHENEHACVPDFQGAFSVVIPKQLTSKHDNHSDILHKSSSSSQKSKNICVAAFEYEKPELKNPNKNGHVKVRETNDKVQQDPEIQTSTFYEPFMSSNKVKCFGKIHLSGDTMGTTNGVDICYQISSEAKEEDVGITSEKGRKSSNELQRSLNSSAYVEFENQFSSERMSLNGNSRSSSKDCFINSETESNSNGTDSNDFRPVADEYKHNRKLLRVLNTLGFATNDFVFAEEDRLESIEVICRLKKITGANRGIRLQQAYKQSCKRQKSFARNKNSCEEILHSSVEDEESGDSLIVESAEMSMECAEISDVTNEDGKTLSEFDSKIVVTEKGLSDVDKHKIIAEVNAADIEKGMSDRKIQEIIQKKSLDNKEYYTAEKESENEQHSSKRSKAQKEKSGKKLKKESLYVVVGGDTVLKKYWRKRFSLFSKFDEGVKLDAESWYSVTPENMAKNIADRCRSDLIIDAFCGAGGNTIQFAFTCERVIAIDIDPVKIELAKNNAKVYGVDDRIEFIIGDFFNLAPHLKADVIFLSPPWGGPEYLQTKLLPLSAIMEQCGGAERLYSLANNVTSNVAIYLPRNVNVNEVIKLAKTTGAVELDQCILGDRLLAITAYFGDLRQYSKNEEIDDYSETC